jgi:glutathione synthase/RimK-type ligase-like ATP-grasp enzyme
MKNCAILTMDNLENYECYDELLDEPLAGKGWKTELVSWRTPNVNWAKFDVVIIRSPWDYQDDADAFLAVLHEIKAVGVPLDNSIETVKWNIDKIYLADLSQKEVNIVPTLWQDTFSSDKLDGYFEHFNTDQIIIKPRISANADNTFWLKKDSAMLEKMNLEQAFEHRNFMVQPFIETVLSEGEFSMFYFDGQYSHAILKTPKEDDFRVQEEHGGRLKLITPETGLVNQSEETLATITEVIGEMPLYARLDFVRVPANNKGQVFALMEAELIEPSLYFNMDSESPQRFADAFEQRMARKSAN